ncbi:MAG: cytosine permease [Myxococcales bacterium]|nr:cytosine permease [Myxococcales bacterium]MDH5306605.1 cytosine permease [Myxococcales bacterium]MDH5565836.1 cytosine permease [Myxococcales bacterium]
MSAFEPELDTNTRAELVKQESFSGRLPLRIGEREYKTVGAHATCFAYAVATWCFLTGGFTAELVGAVEGMVCLIAGNLLGCFLVTMPLSLGCQRYGIEQIDFCKPAFGQRGAKVVLIFYVINMIGWSGLILVMFGNGIRNILHALGYSPGGWIVGAGVALGIWITYLIVTRGVHLLNLSNAFITPGIGILVAFMFYVLFTEYGWEAISNAKPLNPGPSPTINYIIALELGIANGYSWWGGIGFIARNTNSRRNAVYPQLLHLGLSAGVVCTVALFSALVVQSDDPTEWMVPIGGLVVGVLALAFVALANITSTAVSLFATGLALRHIPALRVKTWRTIILLTIVPCLPFVFWPAQLYDLGDAYLAYNGTMHGPIAGILFVDFLFLRKQRLSLWSIFDDDAGREYHYEKGFNWPSIVSVVAGQASYFFLYNPITNQTHDLTRFLPASIAAFALPAALYWILMRIAALRERRAALETGIAAADIQAGPQRTGRPLLRPNI